MSILRKSDFWLGLVVLVGGFWSYTQSLGFDENSSSYPLYLSILHIVLGAGLMLEAFRKAEHLSDTISRLFDEMRGPLVVAAMLFGWGALLLFNVGYLLSSIIMLPLLLYSLGYRGAARITLVTIGITAVIFILFYVVFEVPLPLNQSIEPFFD